jgi:hypothetical protein
MNQAALPDDIRTRILDEEHLRLLSLGYLVSAGLSVFFSLFGLMYATMGSMMAGVPKLDSGAPQPDFAAMRYFFLVFGLGWTAISLAFAALEFHTSRCLQKRRSRVFCMVVAALNCPAFPHGTILGVATFLVLSRSSVERVFDAPAPVSNPSAA